MAEHRDRFFLATKTGERRGDAARAELERSLERLQVDSVDLIQLHNLVEPDEWEVAHGPGGAVEALAQARDEGLVRHIGVTGHGNRIAGHAPAQPRAVPVRLGAAAVQLRRAAGRPPTAPTSRQLLAVCAERAGGRADHQGDRPPPLARRTTTGLASAGTSRSTDPDAIGRAVRWVLGHEQVFLNTSSDARLLPAILAAAAALAGPVPTDEELQADVDAHGIEPLFDGELLERI